MACSQPIPGWIAPQKVEERTNTEMDSSETAESRELVFKVERVNRHTGESRQLKQTIVTRRQEKLRMKREAKLKLHAQTSSDIPI